MGKNQTTLLVVAGVAILVLMLSMRKKAAVTAVAGIPPAAKVSTGTSVWSTLISTVGSTAVGIFGNGSNTGAALDGSGGYSVNYTDSSLRLGGG
jgi:hypothetical protein